MTPTAARPGILSITAVRANRIHEIKGLIIL